MYRQFNSLQSSGHYMYRIYDLRAGLNVARCFVERRENWRIILNCIRGKYGVSMWTDWRGLSMVV
jgi:hypothetical protein